MMNINSFADNISYRHTRVKTRIRVLKYHLHLSSIGEHIHRDFFLFVKYDVSVVYYCSVCGLVKP